jgi:hypothetical protein
VSAGRSRYQLTSAVLMVSVGSFSLLQSLVVRHTGWFQGLLRQTVEPSDGGPAKNILSLSPAGRGALASWAEQWRPMTHRVASLLEETQ